MSDNEPTSDLERDGVDLANQGQYAEARRIFERVLTTKAVPLHRAQVLRNIGLTYEREGNREAALGIYQEILAVPDLCETTEGLYLHTQITGHVHRLQGGSVWTFPSVYGMFAAYFAGAAIGASLGSKVQSAGNTLFGYFVYQDLRYGGACLGALVGIFLFTHIAVAAGPAISLIGGIACAVLTTYILLQENVTLGLMILANLILWPLFIGSLLPAKFRNR